VKTHNRKTIRNIIFAGCLLAGTFGGTELLHGGQWNSIHWAVYHGNTTELEDALARYKINHSLGQTDELEQQDEFGRTPLHLAAERGDISAVEVLLQAGANVNAQTPNGKSVLGAAVQRDHLEIMKRLLKAGVHVNVGPARPNYFEHDNNPLGIAMTHTNFKAVKMLLKAGAFFCDEPRNEHAYRQAIIQKRGFGAFGTPTKEQEQAIDAIIGLLKNYPQLVPLL
jgi:hypothetical protein